MRRQEGIEVWMVCPQALERRKIMKKQNVLQRLARSSQDRKIAGICGGLGEHTGFPSWFWRFVFLASLFLYGTGFFAYVLLWIFMPQASVPQATVPQARKGEEKRRPRKPNWLQQLTRSDVDKKLGGVCGGLGKSTAVPTWCWRMGFVALSFLYAIGVGLYLLLWMFIPRNRMALVRTNVSMAR